MNGKHEVTTPLWRFIVVGVVLVALITTALAGVLFALTSNQVAAYEQESTAVEAPLIQQRDATAMAAEAKTVLAEGGIIAGEGNIETIYATTPDKLTIVTSYGEDTPNEEVRAVAATAWGAGLGEVDGVETVEVMVKDAEGLNSPLFMLDEDEI